MRENQLADSRLIPTSRITPEAAENPRLAALAQARSLRDVTSEQLLEVLPSFARFTRMYAEEGADIKRMIVRVGLPPTIRLVRIVEQLAYVGVAEQASGYQRISFGEFSSILNSGTYGTGLPQRVIYGGIVRAGQIAVVLQERGDTRNLQDVYEAIDKGRSGKTLTREQAHPRRGRRPGTKNKPKL